MPGIVSRHPLFRRKTNSSSNASTPNMGKAHSGLVACPFASALFVIFLLVFGIIVFRG